MSAERSVELARELVLALLAHGVREAVLSPGSRSGPLALALAAADRQHKIRLHVRVDEREAGFLALGLAKGSHRMVPVVTTSGTAVVNLHPAMLEAKHASVRLLAISADRPARLRGTGANQTTDQREIFAGIPFIDRISALATVRDGPCHLNLEFDEPLIEPIAWAPFDAKETAAASQPLEPGSRIELPLGPRTVVIAGDDARQAARHLAEAAGWPLLAEPSSGSRNGMALSAYRLLLKHAPLAGRIERVISFGHATLSRPVTGLLARPDLDIIHVGGPATFPVPAGPRVVFAAGVTVSGRDDTVWLNDWQLADRAARAAIDAVLDGSSCYDVARAVAAAVPSGGLLFAGSSSPIRDLDLMACPYPVGERRYVMANRGLSGIDGTLSTAIGAALARNPSKAIAYVGDLTFLHGSNGLLIGPAEPRPDLTIVVAANDGGGIFASLEQGSAEYAEVFERVYGTPTGASIGELCRGYGVAHEIVEPRKLAAALSGQPRGIRVLEVPVDRFAQRQLAAQLADAVRAALAARLP